MRNREIELIENAREVFETSKEFIPSGLKVEYLNKLAQIGYFAIDLGKYELNPHSRFSDLDEVISSIDKKDTRIIILSETKEGYFRALENPKVDFIELPFSLLKEIEKGSLQSKRIIAGVSLNFDKNFRFDENALRSIIVHCAEAGIDKIKIYNQAIVEATTHDPVSQLGDSINQFPDIEFISHFYVKEENCRSVFDFIYSSGCSFIETSIKGRGRSATGSTMPTEKVLTYLMAIKEKTKIDVLALETTYNTARKIFSES